MQSTSLGSRSCVRVGVDMNKCVLVCVGLRLCFPMSRGCLVNEYGWCGKSGGSRGALGRTGTYG